MAESRVSRSGPMQLHHSPTANREVHPQPRQYLSLQRLSVKELPPHPELSALYNETNETNTSLPQFLNTIIAEVDKVDFDKGWTSHGKWHPDGTHVQMPALPNAEDYTTKPVPISVHQRVRVTDKATWLARTSYHLETDVKYSELDNLLSQDHSRNEARYTPSVYDANELLAWSPQDLEKAVAALSRDYNTQSVQMSIFQMFHKMPDLVGGLSLLEDRVFHVLVITAHFTGPAHTSSGIFHSYTGPRSFTVQLPVDIESFNNVNTIMQRNTHVQKKRYNTPSNAASEAQKKRIGKKVTEGNYVSLERLCQASKDLPVDETVTLEEPPQGSDYHHRWDMMTLSTAGGITRLAPKRTEQNETLKAIAMDVDYVVRHIAEARKRSLSHSKSGDGG